LAITFVENVSGSKEDVEHTEGDGGEMFNAVCKLGLEGIVSKKLDAPYKSGPSKAWLKIKTRKPPRLHEPSTARFDAAVPAPSFPSCG
jgi:ATP-dependent DNA ligase